MKDKTEAQYTKVLEKVVELTKISPKLVRNDFEKGLNNAGKKSFQRLIFDFVYSILINLSLKN
jgi:hypothetical protein